MTLYRPSGGGRKDMNMNTAVSSLGTSTSAASRAVQLGFAALLGVFIVGALTGTALPP